MSQPSPSLDDTNEHALTFMQKLGPGLITGASDDDPSGIATYSQVGAQFGYSIGWTLIFSYPLMCAIQLISADIGRVTGHGIAGNLRRYYPAWIMHVLIALLVIANMINIGADIGAMGAAVNLLVGGPILLYGGLFAIVSLLLEIFVDYSKYVAVLKWLTLSLFAYAATVFAVHVPWDHVAHELIVPHLSLSAEYITAVVAVFGTTISPYLFFWQASSEVERECARPGLNALKRTPHKALSELKRIRLDTLIGMGFSNLIALFIVITTSATLNAHGVTNIETSSQAAEALRPIAGNFTYLVFALGIIGTGLLALPVLAGSAAYALGEAWNWPVGLGKTFPKAKKFYMAIAVLTLGGSLLNLIGLDPVKALFASAVINGVTAVPIMAMLMIMASNRNIMGQFRIKSVKKILGWAATVIMGLVAVGMLVTWKSS